MVTRTEQIKILTQQLATARSLKEAARVSYNTASCLETQATSALELLGAKPGQAQSGLSDKDKADLMIQLTKKGNRKGFNTKA